MKISKHKEKIVECAQLLILQKGVTQTSTQDIAEAVGISKGTLYYHFKSKEEIVLEVADRYFLTLDSAVDALIESVSKRLRLDEIVGYVLNFFEAKRNLERMHYLLMAYALTSNEALRERFAKKHISWHSDIKKGLDSYAYDETNGVFADFILALVDGLALKNVMGIEVFSDGDVVSLLKKFIMK